MPLLRNSQGLSLGLGRSTGAATGTLTGTILRSSMLMDLVVASQGAAGECVVDEIKVAGQNLNVSSEGAAVEMFGRDAQCEGHRSLSIPLEQNLPVSLDFTLSAAADIAAGINTDPIENDAAIVPVDQLGAALNYFGGLGTAAVGAGASGTLTTTIRRRCRLGLLSLAHNGSVGDFMVTSVQLNNVEMLSGSGTAAAVPAENLQFDCTDIDGRILGLDAEPNSVLTITVTNTAAGALDISGGFFCLHR